jgi:hypothetical protein
VLRPATRPLGFAAIVKLDDVLAEAGETVSQLAEEVAANDTAADGEVVNEICVDTGVVEPAATVAGVQDVRLGVTVGGGVPEAASVAFESVKLPELLAPPDAKVKLTVD